MKKKYVELNNENIELYTNRCRCVLSSNINSKKEYCRYINFYNSQFNVFDAGLSYVLNYIEELISEINELSKRINFLEKDRLLTSYNHNLLLGSNENINKDKINKYRDSYNQIINELDILINYRNNLRSELNDCKNSCSILVKEKKKINKKINKSIKNFNVCNYNINVCYKVLDRLDNIYMDKIENVSESYIIPKVKRIK